MAVCKDPIKKASKYLFFLEHVRLPQYLHCIDVSSVELLDESNFTKCTPTNDLQAFEILFTKPRATQAKKLGLFLSMLLTMNVTLKIVTESG